MKESVAAAQKLKAPGAMVLAVSKRFGRFKDEDEKAVRAPDLAEDQTLRRLKEAWGKVKWKQDDETTNYPACLEAIKAIR